MHGATIRAIATLCVCAFRRNGHAKSLEMAPLDRGFGRPLGGRVPNLDLLAQVKDLSRRYEESNPPHTAPARQVRQMILEAGWSIEDGEPNARKLLVRARRGVSSWTRWLEDETRRTRAIWVWESGPWPNGETNHSVGWPIRAEFDYLSEAVNPATYVDQTWDEAITASRAGEE